MAKSLPKKWKWTYPTARYEVLTPTFTFLVGILPSSTLRTFWGGTIKKNHPVYINIIFLKAFGKILGVDMVSPEGSETTIMFDIFSGREAWVLEEVRVDRIMSYEVLVSSFLCASPLSVPRSVSYESFAEDRMTIQGSGSSRCKPTSWLQVFQMVRISFLIVRMSWKFLQNLLVSISLLAWVR